MTQRRVFKSMMVMIMVSMFHMTISMIKLLVVKVERAAVRHSDDFCVCRQGSAVKSTPDQNRVIRQKKLWALKVSRYESDQRFDKKMAPQVL